VTPVGFDLFMSLEARLQKALEWVQRITGALQVRELIARYEINLLKKQAIRVAERKRVEILARRLMEEIEKGEIDA
jgi:hypothetical protein